MAKSLSSAEMRKMSADDLRKDVAAKKSEIAEAKIGIKAGKVKDTARVRRDRKELARMLTILNEQTNASSALKPAKKSSKVPAPASPSK